MEMQSKHTKILRKQWKQPQRMGKIMSMAPSAYIRKSERLQINDLIMYLNSLVEEK